MNSIPRFLLPVLALLAGSASATPVATGSVYDIADPGLLPTADNILAGKVPERTAGTYTGTWYESLPASLACVTDGAIPNQGSDCNALPDARALMDIDGTLTWTWDAAEAVKDVRIYTQWGDGWRCDVSVKSIELRIGGTWTALANSAFDYSFMSDWNTVAQYDGDQSHKTRRVVFADSDPDANLANAATGLRITFGDQCFNNGSLGYGAYWEIEATRGVSGDDLTFEVMNTVNGGTDYVGIGEVAVKHMPFAADYEEYQFTVGDAQPAADGWQAYTPGTVPADVISFTLPQTLDADVTVHCRLRGDGLADLDLTDTIKSAYGAQPTIAATGDVSVFLANDYDGARVTAAQLLAATAASDSHGGIVSVVAEDATVFANTNLVVTATNLAGNSASCTVYVTPTPVGGALPQAYFRTLLHLGADFNNDSLQNGDGIGQDYLQNFGGERTVLPRAGVSYSGLTTVDTATTPGSLVWTISSSGEDLWRPQPDRSNYIKYWHVYVVSPDERDIVWRYLCDDNLRVFVNGELQIDSGWVGGNTSANGHLRRGVNSITIKLNEAGGDDWMQLALRRDDNGNYFDDLQYRFDPGFQMADASTGDRFALSSGQARIAALPRLRGYTRYQVFQDDAEGTVAPGETWTAYDPDALPAAAIPYVVPANPGDDVSFSVVLSDETGGNTTRQTVVLATVNTFGSVTATPMDSEATIAGTANLIGVSGTAVMTFGTDPASLTRTVSFSINAAGEFSGTVSNLAANTTYYWQVEIMETGTRTGVGTGEFTTLGFETFGDCAVLNGSAASAGTDAVITFRENGRIRFSKAVTVDALLVGGGGGGGEGGFGGGGGGGAGGVVYQQGISLAAGEYAVVVGAGGAENAKGQNSSFAYLVAVGGGAGYHGYGDHAADPDADPSNGGSGGGAASVNNYQRAGGTGVEGQGHDGGSNLAKTIVDLNLVPAGYHAVNNSTQELNAGGGGGGAGAPGGGGTVVDPVLENDGRWRVDNYRPGRGGDGIVCAITGQDVIYGGGGAGGHFGWYRYDFQEVGGAGGGGSCGFYHDQGTQRDGGDGVDGLGGGGGGGAANGDGATTHGGHGGSGIVIVRFTQKFAEDSYAGTGGTITKKDGFMIHSFTESGTFELPNSTYADILLVGGGGGGGNGYGGGGGGGAGGMIYLEGTTILAGKHQVVVGAGGLGGTRDNDQGANGEDSSFNGHTAFGGGGGGGIWSTTSSSGGSGGGAFSPGMPGNNQRDRFGGTGTPGQGCDGGSIKLVDDQSIHFGAGGGGAGEKGHSSSVNGPGKGGDGLPCSITGEEKWYAGGGAGGTNANVGRENTQAQGGKGGGGDSGYWPTGVDPVNHYGPSDNMAYIGHAENGTGGGGGGGALWGNGSDQGPGGNGGSGIVIIRYRLRPNATVVMFR